MEVVFNVKNQYLLRYLEFLFEKKNDKLIVSRTTDFGRLCISHLKRSTKPVPVEKSDLSVTFLFPKSINLPQIAERNWLYYDHFDMKRLNDALVAESNIDFKLYYLAGMEKNFMQKDIINAYIESRRISIDDFDRLQKRCYRSSLSANEKIHKYLSNKIQFIARNIKIKMPCSIDRFISES